ncbi:MAG: Gfo/Idh/MocA family oxidoreductase [Bryobacteraceae bacterium]
MWNNPSRRSFLAAAMCTTAGFAAAPKRYRVAVIGHTGHGDYGHGIDVVWKHFEQMDVVAVADADSTGRAAAAKRTGARRSYADYREMLRVEKPELVGIGPRWLDQRRDMVIAAADAGAHIFLEKAFAISLEDADRMVAAVQKNRVKLQVAHQMRTSPFAIRAKAMLMAGEIGTVQEVRVRGKEDRRAGGEDMMVLGPHVADMMRYFLGDPKWVVSHVTRSGEEISAKDTTQPTEPVGPIAGTQVSAMFAFADGVHGYFASRASDQTDALRFGTWIYGSKGVLFLPNSIYPGGGLYVLRTPAWLPDERSRWERIDAKADPIPGFQGDHEMGNALLVADLLRAIEQDGKPCCNEVDGRWTIEMMHGIYRAQQTGSRVSFPLKSRAHPLAG